MIIIAIPRRVLIGAMLMSAASAAEALDVHSDILLETRPLDAAESAAVLKGLSELRHNGPQPLAVTGKIRVFADYPQEIERTWVSLMLLYERHRTGDVCTYDVGSAGGQCTEDEELADCTVRLSLEPYPTRYAEFGCRAEAPIEAVAISNLVSIGDMSDDELQVGLGMLRSAVNKKSRDELEARWDFINPLVFADPVRYLDSLYFGSEGGAVEFAAIFDFGSQASFSVHITEDGRSREVEFYEVVE